MHIEYQLKIHKKFNEFYSPHIFFLSGSVKVFMNAHIAHIIGSNDLNRNVNNPFDWTYFQLITFLNAYTKLL